MGDEEASRASGPDEDVRPSYWLDACEDITCDDLIRDFADLDSVAISEPLDAAASASLLQDDGLLDPCFFDGIFDSITECGGSAADVKLEAVLEEIQVEGSVRSKCEATSAQSNGLCDSSAITEECEAKASALPGNHHDLEKGKKLLDGRGDSGSVCSPERNGSYRDGKGDHALPRSPERNGSHRHEVRGRGVHMDQAHDDSQERFGKRPRLERQSTSSSRQQHSLPRERPSRKRERDWEETDRRDKDSVRRREHYGKSRRGDERDRDRREGRGYWERDRSGKNEMVFRVGSWKTDCCRDGTVPFLKNQDQNGGEPKKFEGPKEKIHIEQARKYQLDVLEQAKSKNTIAFLETGAGKTLIAVLLMKSLFTDLQRDGKKMLAVFLVPKVPLVYQVIEKSLAGEIKLPAFNCKLTNTVVHAFCSAS